VIKTLELMINRLKDLLAHLQLPPVVCAHNGCVYKQD